VDLNLLWFVLLGALLAGYAVLDGFDLGVGILHLTARTDTERRLRINSIGPLWDGNEVWLITFGGAMFAAFPAAYATVFSGFYTAFMLLLLALIFRAVSIEFRSKRDAPSWRRLWDGSFSGASLLATFLFGCAAGNVQIGIPVDAAGVFTGSFLSLLRPYPVLAGVLAVAVALTHGALYLNLKMEGEPQLRVRRWIWRGYGLSLACLLAAALALQAARPQAARNFAGRPWAWAVVALLALALANIPRAVRRSRPLVAFLCSSAAIAALVFLFAFSLFPNLVISSISPEYNLTMVNAASSPKTLGIMAVIALVGMPLVIAYTAVVYWVFRGKTRLTEHSY